jgi:hypothetical protein
VIRVENKEKVGGGSIERGEVRGEGGLHISSSVINQHTVLTYSYFIQFLYIASEYMALYK